MYIKGKELISMVLEKDTSPIVKEDEEIVCGENCEDCPDARDCLDAWED